MTRNFRILVTRLARGPLRACSMKGPSLRQNAVACFLFKPISYSVPPMPNRIVSSAGPPSRSSSSATIT